MDEGPPELAPAELPGSRHVRWAYFALAWLFFALGVIGILLPVMPTTPFMLLALWAFSRSSRRFHDWLYTHPIFGATLRRWRRDRVIPAWIKAVALLSMAASMTYVATAVRPPWYGLVAMGAVVAAGIVYVVRIPSAPRGR